MEKITIAIVDDHELFREGIKLVLNQIENFEVIFETPNGQHYLEFLKNNIPDITLMDIEMPVISGIETTKKALIQKKDLKIIALSMFSDLSNYKQMIHAGVKGFLLKKSNKFELQQAIEMVNKGGNFFSQEIIQKLAFYSLNKNYEVLSARELEILQLVCKGYTSQEIANQLFISLKTVEVHRTNIFNKANVRNAAELIIWAIKNDFFSIA